MPFTDKEKIILNRKQYYEKHKVRMATDPEYKERYNAKNRLRASQNYNKKKGTLCDKGIKRKTALDKEWKEITHKFSSQPT